MKNLQKWLTLAFFLFMQFSACATDTEHTFPLDFQNSVYKIMKPKTEEDYKNGVINLGGQNIDNKTVNKILEKYANINLFDSPRDHSRDKSLDLSNSLLTDSDAISLACAIGHIPEVGGMSICRNAVTDIGIKAILIKIFENKEMFTFCFTAQQNIKSDIESLAQKYKKLLVWKQSKSSLEDGFDFEVCIKGQTVNTSDLKDDFE